MRGQQGPAAPAPRLIKVADDLYVIQNANHTVAEIGQNGGNVSVIVTRDGVILVDSKFERMHDDIMAKVRSVTDRPVRYLVLTHNHGDHSGGAARFQSMGVTVVSSVASRENMARANMAGRAQVAYSGSAELELGGTRLELRELRGHTRGDTVVSLPARRARDRGRPGDDAGFHPRDRQLRRRRQLDRARRVARGDRPHGLRRPRRRPRSEPDEGRVHRLQDKVHGIRERFRALIREKKTQDEIAQALIKEFNWGSGPAAGNLAGMMQELR